MKHQATIAFPLQLLLCLLRFRAGVRIESVRTVERNGKDLLELVIEGEGLPCAMPGGKPELMTIRDAREATGGMQ